MLIVNFRHAIEDSLERAFVPALAAVISFIDVRDNLQMLTTDDADFMTHLWMSIFMECHKLGLTFEQLTRNNEQTNLSSVSLFHVIDGAARTYPFINICQH